MGDFAEAAGRLLHEVPLTDSRVGDAVRDQPPIPRSLRRYPVGQPRDVHETTKILHDKSRIVNNFIYKLIDY